MSYSLTIQKMKDFLAKRENKYCQNFVPENLSEEDKIKFRYKVCQYHLEKKREREQNFINYEKKWHGMLCPAAPGLDKYSLSSYNYSRYLELAKIRIEKQNKEIENLKKNMEK